MKGLFKKIQDLVLYPNDIYHERWTSSELTWLGKWFKGKPVFLFYVFNILYRIVLIVPLFILLFCWIGSTLFEKKGDF